MPVRFRFTRALPLIVLAFSAGHAHAQASPYVPLDDWAMPYVEHLIRAGVMADPDPLTRPLRAGAIVAALQKADTSRASPAIRATVRDLIDRLTPRGEPPQFRMRLYGGGTAATQARRDPLREAGDGFESYILGGHLTAAFGPVALSERVDFNRRLWRDPDYKGTNEAVSFPGYQTDAYASIQGQYGEFFLGAMQRNWGPTGVDGTLVSPEPYAYDHLMGRLGTRSLRVEALYTQLDDYVRPTGEREQRHWATQRLFIQPFRSLTFVVTEATLWAGVGRGIEFRWLNPFRESSTTQLTENAPQGVKSHVGASMRVQLPHRIVFQGDLMIADLRDLPIVFTSINLPLGTSAAPSRLAETLVLDVPFSPVLTVRGLYTLVTNLTYRTDKGPADVVMLRGVGLGRNFADYTQLTLSASLLPRPMLTLAPELTILKQGEGDFRQPFPPCSPSCLDIPVILSGVVERTVRTALTGRMQLRRYIDLDGNAGVHFISNRNHVTGASATRFVAGIALTYRLDQLIKLP